MLHQVLVFTHSDQIYISERALAAGWHIEVGTGGQVGDCRPIREDDERVGGPCRGGEEWVDLGDILEVKLLLISSRLNVFVKDTEEFWIMPKFLGFINRKKIHPPAVDPEVGMF